MLTTLTFDGTTAIKTAATTSQSKQAALKHTNEGDINKNNTCTFDNSNDIILLQRSPEHFIKTRLLCLPVILSINLKLLTYAMVEAIIPELADGKAVGIRLANEFTEYAVSRAHLHAPVALCLLPRLQLVEPLRCQLIKVFPHPVRSDDRP